MIRSFCKSRFALLFARTMLVSLVALLIVACSNTSTGPQAAASPTASVNGFGVAANHVHSLLVFPSHVLILATHYGLFRSQDDGASWQEVAGGPHQLMDGLLTLPAVIPYAGPVGLYTSADEGRTWKLSIPAASLTSKSIFVVAPGNETPDEVYVYVPDLGPLGLEISLDNGQHFSKTGTLPFGSIFGLLAIPGVPGHVIAYGSDGMASSTDGGIHWQVYTTINGGIDNMTTAGPHSPIYASGDAGIYSSLDGGKTFKLVYTQASFTSLAVSPIQPQVVYGKTGTSTYRSNDGGHSWNALPHISGNLAVLAVDPTNAADVFLSLSYPTELYRLNQNSSGWLSLTPPTLAPA